MAAGSFVLKYTVSVAWVPDGASAMEVPSAQVISMFPSANNPAGITAGNGYAVGSPVPGGSAPTQANFVTALGNLGTDIAAQLAANNSALLARIQGFASGTG